MASEVRIRKLRKAFRVLCSILLLLFVIALVMIICARIPIVNWVFLVIFYAAITLALCLVIVAAVTLKNLSEEMYDFAQQYQPPCPVEKQNFDDMLKKIRYILIIMVVLCAGLLGSGWVDINWATGVTVVLFVVTVALIAYLNQFRRVIGAYIVCVQS